MNNAENCILQLLKDAYIEGYFKGQLNEHAAYPEKEFNRSSIKKHFDALFPKESSANEQGK